MYTHIHILMYRGPPRHPTARARAPRPARNSADGGAAALALRGESGGSRDRVFAAGFSNPPDDARHRSGRGYSLADGADCDPLAPRHH